MALAKPERDDQAPMSNGWTETEKYRVPKEWIRDWIEDPKPPNRPPGRSKPAWFVEVFSNTLFTARK